MEGTQYFVEVNPYVLHSKREQHAIEVSSAKRLMIRWIRFEASFLRDVQTLER